MDSFFIPAGVLPHQEQWNALPDNGDQKNRIKKGNLPGDYGTILEMGISRMSSAPQALSCGISWFTIFFGTTVWML